ncbi:MAG: formate C-acetyltransferase [Deltaproteobacteria bacterium]|nr:formate C-acetyltransferase [Deltaproteobacteria bacterium]
MNKRIMKLKDRLHVERYPICTEKGILITESFQESERQPEVIRNAKALEKILDNITIFIEDDELIVGNPASKPMGAEIFPIYAPWPEEEIDGLTEEGITTSEEDLSKIREMNSYWKGKTFRERMGQLFDDDRLWPYVQLGIVLPRWGNHEWAGGGWVGGGYSVRPEPGILVFDYGKIIHNGLKEIIQDAEKELLNTRISSADAVEKIYFLRAVIIAHNAVIRFANRFAILAGEMAAKEEDLVRKRELERIVATCQWIPANGARDFYEAIQFLWFLFLVLNPAMSVSFGRFDQYMYPFYKKDIEEGKISDGEVIELLECLRIKDMQLYSTGGRVNRDKWSGYAKWHNMIIGGQTPEGKDASNELSYLILEAAKDCPTPHHTVTLRVHEGTPHELMMKALEVVKTGIGMPAFVGDKSYIAFLVGQGVPIELARDYTIAGCLDVQLASRTRTYFPMFIATRIFEFALNNGVDPQTGKQVGPITGGLETFTSIDEIIAAFKEQLAYFLDIHVEYQNCTFRTFTELYPQPIESSFMVDGLKVGKDIFNRTMPFENGTAINPVGVINIADSLAAVKKLIFDEKMYTMKQLKKALAANWQGNGYDEMRKKFLSAPKFGNDDRYVDDIAGELYRIFAEISEKYHSCLGGTFKASGISISAQWPGGAFTGATPDGRNAGEVLADGSMSPMRGRDTRGPTAVIKSALRIDQQPYQATLLNMKFHPSSLQTIEDQKKLAALIRTYFDNGGKHIQFNIVGKETLLDAQVQPDNYPDLIVRVAGYSAYFVQLGKPIQDEVIGRTEEPALC